MDAGEISALIEQLAPACKSAGVKRLRLPDGMELEFGGSTDVSDVMMKKFQQFMEQGMPSDEDALNWSAPGWKPPAPADAPAPSRTRGRRS